MAKQTSDALQDKLQRSRHALTARTHTKHLSDHSTDEISSYRVIATELHGTANDHDRDELPAYRAISKKLPGVARPHSFGFSLFLQDLIQLATLDLTASQASQS